jgi:hypothetical protein
MQTPKPLLPCVLLAGALAVPAAAAAPPAQAPIHAAQPSAHAAALRTAEGSVVAVDADAKTLTLRGKGGDLTFAWDGATTVVGRKSPQYLKPGSRVTVQYATAGAVRQARTITVQPPPKRMPEQG